MGKTFDWSARRTAIRQGKPIEELGLTFYPIKMSFYEQFLACKDALLLRQSTLPVKYISCNFLDAVFRYEIDAVNEGKSGSGMFYRLMLLLAMSLGIDIDIGEYLANGNIAIKADKTGKETLVIKMTQNEGESPAEISSKDFSQKIRPLIAEQNGLELPDEADNNELVEAEEEMRKLQQGGNLTLNGNVGDLISTVAYLSNVRETEIDEWTIREFENRKRAIDRTKNYTLYRQAELSGMVTFKKGNPYPSLYFDTVDDKKGLMSMAAMAKQMGGAQQK